MVRLVRVLQVAGLSALLLSLASLAACGAAEGVRVARVVDGDTIVLVDGTRVRIAGIDAPELRPVAEPGAREAHRALSRFVAGRSVTLERATPGLDDYGRVLARVLLEEVGDVGAELLRQGHAEVFWKSDLATEYFPLEARAWTRGLGLWASVEVVVPRHAAGRTGRTVIVEGVVSGVRSPGGHRFLDFRHGGSVVFTASIFRETVPLFERDPIELEGRRVRVLGRLRDGPRGHVEMVIPHPSRIDASGPGDPDRQ